MKAPTTRQLAILRFWAEYTDEHGRPPTTREVGARFAIKSTNGVRDHVLSLERKGCLRVNANESGATLSRGTTITKIGRAAVGLFEPTPRRKRSPGVTIGETRCKCGLVHFRLGRTFCAKCEVALLQGQSG